MNCIFCCVFNQEKYVNMFLLLLESMLLYANLDDNTHILVYTSTLFMTMIKDNHLYDETKVQFEINDDYNTINKACKARLDLFNLPSVVKYDKILYLDTDIIVRSDINKVFAICKNDILYVLEEGFIDDKSNSHGLTLFGAEIHKYKDKTAFTSGILLFNNCQKIKDLFENIVESFKTMVYKGHLNDQPFFIYNAFKYNIYNNKLLNKLAVNYPIFKDQQNFILYSNEKLFEEFKDRAIHHFPNGAGKTKNKLICMNMLLNKLHSDTFKNGMKLYNVKHKPPMNTHFSLIGLCVSYNYYDTLKFMLPVNYAHFEQIYIITQEHDTTTIDFCKSFANVTILYFDFFNNSKRFDKYGALNYAQKIAYTDYPDSWYLIIDSDIILPNNFIDILSEEQLHAECIYGVTRIDFHKSSEILQKTEIMKLERNKKWIDYALRIPPTIVGYFQLYKKKVFHPLTLDNASEGDYLFSRNNFNMFCSLNNLYCLHLGVNGLNWFGKVESFIDDVNVTLNNVYYKCYKHVNNVIYTDKKKLVKYGNTPNINDLDCTLLCSDQMRFDIYTFFKSRQSFTIAEFGAHKGYFTKILANMFKMVYAIDNNSEWTEFNKKLNKNATNIEYVTLDIHKESWNILPNDIDVVFMNTLHTYEGCKSNIINFLHTFESLQYIICDHYGVWPGVKQVVDELILNETLRFETFIGLTDVPWSTGIKKNVNEGIICSVTRNIAKPAPTLATLTPTPTLATLTPTPTPAPTPDPTPAPTLATLTLATLTPEPTLATLTLATLTPEPPPIEAQTEPQLTPEPTPIEAQTEPQLLFEQFTTNRSKAKPRPKFKLATPPTPQATPTPTLPIFKVHTTSQNVKNVKKNNFTPSLLAWNQYSHNYAL
jgi:lipopolysaccharide biosynthesis glycosyltransferase